MFTCLPRIRRWPTIFLSLILLPKGIQRFSSSVLENLQQGREIKFDTADALITFAVVIAVIPRICWMAALMYKSYSVSCRMKGARAVWTFISGLLIAEILSKIAIYRLLKGI